jgi:hypothetical protein
VDSCPTFPYPQASAVLAVLQFHADCVFLFAFRDRFSSLLQI